jgi:DNA-binding transcriptional regulator YhcF (GntR family)
MMGRAPLWTAIRDTLRQEIATGQYRGGDKLPTEARLADRFGVNRHTIRRALADLAEEKGDFITNDFAIERATVHEKFAWMLRSHLED